ncbi:MAG: tryptophan synthase subunit alpha [Acidobacteria bacterium RIFCSPLOWO2_12_FULL_67_14b]|nr:MAG: tryptophan synthase subunit alpha [Acidobacteria bacterium RIFCSPLOWO2_12_FULL_67_14b]
MSRIDRRFAELRAAGRTGLITYVTAGDPDLARSAEILKRLDRAGADVLEVGVPFSDPLADGPVIQRATERALAAGATLENVLTMLAGVRSEISAPVVIFSYANPILRMGLERFVSQAQAAGVDGVLTLDMPPEEGAAFRDAFAAAGIDTIFLLSPTTTVERIRRASALGSGFLYGISRLGVTGVRETIDDSARALADRVRAETAMPIALGFGLSRPEHVRAVGQWADAAVVGSALVKVIAEHGRSAGLLDEVERYVRWLRS